jgi:hypothetical protein
VTRKKATPATEKVKKLKVKRTTIRDLDVKASARRVKGGASGVGAYCMK